MNYHFIVQEKFFFDYIEDIYKLGLQDSNKVLMRGNPGDNPLFHTNRAILYLGNDEKKIIDMMSLMSCNDRIIICWYDMFIGRAILQSGTVAKVYAYCMGGDFYGQPIHYHDNWLYDKQTYKIIKKLFYPHFKLLRRPQHWDEYLHDLRNIFTFKSNLQNKYKEKLEQVARIDYFVTSRNNQVEYDYIKSLYPSFRAKYLFGNFNQNFDLAISCESKHFDLDKKEKYRIYLGNSADPTNNHIDIIKAIPKEVKNCSTLFVQLSYGDKKYREYLLKWLGKCNKIEINPLLEVLPRDEYIDFLNTMDVFVMGHNRQQAVGNIMTALALGKPVFMKKKSVVFQYLRENGIKSVYSIEDLSMDFFVAAIKEASFERNHTIDILKSLISEEARLSDLRRILTE